jgi:hypothetical protein
LSRAAHGPGRGSSNRSTRIAKVWAPVDFESQKESRPQAADD